MRTLLLLSLCVAGLAALAGPLAGLARAAEASDEAARRKKLGDEEVALRKKLDQASSENPTVYPRLFEVRQDRAGTKVLVEVTPDPSDPTKAGVQLQALRKLTGNYEIVEKKVPPAKYAELLRDKYGDQIGKQLEEDEVALRKRLDRARSEDQTLYPFDVQVHRDRGNTKLLVEITLDTSDPTKAEAQAQAVQSLIDEAKNAKQFRSDYQLVVKKVSIAELLAALNDQLDTEPRLVGCYVSDARFEKVNDEQRLVLRGRIIKEEQIGLILSACRRLMQENPAWPSSNPELSRESKEPVPGSEYAADRYYATGLRHYQQRDYREARTAFRQAILNSPDHLEYHYWRIAAEIADGDRDRASRHLRPWVLARRADPYSGAYGDLPKALERLQGPVRYELDVLELEALAVAGP